MKQLLIGLILSGVLATPVPAIAQDLLESARNLYASASYEEALATLTRLHDSSTNPAVLEHVDLYRAFCLFALGRVSDAQQIAESLMTTNPAMTLEIADLSPRIAAMFAEARSRSLPEIVRSHYRIAKTALDNKDYAGAEPELVLVRQALSEAEKINALDATSAALRDLVDGFLDLVHTARSIEPATAEPNRTATTPPTPPTVPSTASPSLPTEGPSVARVFDATYAAVTPPVVVLQEVPPIPASLVALIRARSNPGLGLLDVVIDENGDVESASLRVPIHPNYDRLIVSAAKGWKYRPATKDGTQVKFAKTIAISMQK